MCTCTTVRYYLGTVPIYLLLRLRRCQCQQDQCSNKQKDASNPPHCFSPIRTFQVTQQDTRRDREHRATIAYGKCRRLVDAFRPFKIQKERPRKQQPTQQAGQFFSPRQTPRIDKWFSRWRTARQPQKAVKARLDAYSAQQKQRTHFTCTVKRTSSECGSR